MTSIIQQRDILAHCHRPISLLHQHNIVQYHLCVQQTFTNEINKKYYVYHQDIIYYVDSIKSKISVLLNKIGYNNNWLPTT